MVVSKENRWYVLYTRACHEVKAEEYLIRSGIEAYLPKIKEFRQWSDRKKLVETPLFVSYIFVRVSKKEYDKALQDKSIVRYITLCGQPCPVPDEQIEAIKKVLAGNLSFEVTNEDFEPGDLVVFCDGPLTGYSAEVVNRKGSKEVILRIDGAGQSLLIKSPCAYVSKSPGLTC